MMICEGMLYSLDLLILLLPLSLVYGDIVRAFHSDKAHP